MVYGEEETMTNKTYDVLKKIAMYALPALATLVITLGEIWGWDWSAQVAATITALDTFIGAALGISSKSYNKKKDKRKK